MSLPDGGEVRGKASRGEASGQRGRDGGVADTPLLTHQLSSRKEGKGELNLIKYAARTEP